MTDEPILLTDSPAPFIRRLTLNRPAYGATGTTAITAQKFGAVRVLAKA